MGEPVPSSMKGSYPRRPAIQFFRAILRQWWIAILFILGTIAQSFLQLLFQTNGTPSIQDVSDTFIGHLAQVYTLPFWSTTTVLVLLIPLGLLAQQDYEKEKKALEHEAEETKRSVLVQEHASAVAQAIIDNQIQKVLANLSTTKTEPPYDLDKLLFPEEFINRKEVLNWFIARLQEPSKTHTFSIEALGGIGKTALVGEIVQHVRTLNLYPDGIAVVDCLNRLDPLSVLCDILGRFAPERKSPTVSTLQEITDYARLFLEGKRVLIVLENVEAHLPLDDVIAPLEVVGAALLLTADFRVTPIPAKNAIQLTPLSEAEALLLFKTRYGFPMTEQDEAAARQIVDITGRHTLAIVLAAEYASDTRRPLTAVAAELNDAQKALDLVEGGQSRGATPPRGIRVTLEQGFDKLPTAAQQSLCILSFIATTDYTREAALNILDRCGVTDARANVDLLIRRAFLNEQPAEQSVERLVQGPLIQAFARTMTDAAMQQVASQSMTEYYLQFAQQVATDYQRFEPDYENILGGLTWVHQQGDAADERAQAWARTTLVAYAKVLCHLLAVIGRRRPEHLGTYLDWCIKGCNAAQEFDTEAQLYLELGAYYRAFLTPDAFAKAEACYNRALSLAQQHGYRELEIKAYGRLGDLGHARGTYDVALRARKEEVRLSKDLGDMPLFAAALSSLGHLLTDMRQFTEALPYFARAITVGSEAQALNPVAHATLITGKTYRLMGDAKQARQYDLDAFTRYSALGDLGSVGGCLEELGMLDAAEGKFQVALNHWEKVKDIYTYLGIARARLIASELIEPCKKALAGDSAIRRYLRKVGREADSITKKTVV